MFISLSAMKQSIGQSVATRGQEDAQKIHKNNEVPWFQIWPLHYCHNICHQVAWTAAKFCSRRNEDDKKLPSHTAAPKHQAPQARGPEYGPLSLLPKAGSGIMC